MSCPPVERIKADKSYESDQFGNNAKKMKLVDEQFEKCCEAALNCEKSYQTYKESVESTCQMKIKNVTGIVESKACGFCLEKLSEKRSRVFQWRTNENLMISNFNNMKFLFNLIYKYTKE